MRETGKYKKLGEFDYFIPYALPPKNPELKMDFLMMELYGQAAFALGQLNEMSERLPNAERFLKAYIMKEALLSSSIEGINTTLIDAFTRLIGEMRPNKNTQLVLNYVNSMNTVLSLMKESRFPLVNRVILKAHEVLLSEDGQSSPGEYRKQGVRVGDLIPPSPTEIPLLMSELEKYINEESELPPLIRAGLIHVQFETIHPFLDGNGRIGRLMIILVLMQYGLINSPILYISYYFKKNHSEYYLRLSEVRTKGDFESWIIFYLKAIKESALDAHRRAKDIEYLEQKLKNQIQLSSQFMKMRENTFAVLDYLFMNPITTISEAVEDLDKSFNTINKIMLIMVENGILELKSAQQRNKLFHFTQYLELLNREYTD